MSLTTIDHIMNSMTMDGLQAICPEWMDGEEFSVIMLTNEVSNGDVLPEDILAIKESLSMIAKDYWLQISYSGRCNDTGKFSDLPV